MTQQSLQPLEQILREGSSRVFYVDEISVKAEDAFRMLTPREYQRSLRFVETLLLSDLITFGFCGQKNEQILAKLAGFAQSAVNEHAFIDKVLALAQTLNETSARKCQDTIQNFFQSFRKFSVFLSRKGQEL